MIQALQGNLNDEQSYWLSDAQMARLKPFFPKSHSKPASMNEEGQKPIQWIVFPTNAS